VRVQGEKDIGGKQGTKKGGTGAAELKTRLEKKTEGDTCVEAHAGKNKREFIAWFCAWGRASSMGIVLSLRGGKKLTRNKGARSLQPQANLKWER